MTGGEGSFRLEDLLRPFQAQDLTGQVLSGCTVERLLGRGGMGAVWQARAPDGAAVVVKTLDPGMARDPGLRARFHREWESLAKLHPHPNVVRILKVGDDEQQPHIVMELVQGAALHAHVKRHGPMKPAHAVAAARDAALGLAAVHRHGLVHRDVKPANLMLGPDGRTRLVDFGLAKDLFTTSLTQPGQLLGTASYMAPEQWVDAKVHDPRVDVFALGATLYHLLAGRAPFEGDDVQEVADAIQSGEYPPLAEAAPGTPRELELLVALMLMPEPRFRYARMEDVVEDLEGVLAGRPCRAPALVEAGGRRHCLIPARRLTVGSAAGCGVVIADPAVSPKHAQLRREPAGFVLHDLKGSAGTAVNGAPLTRSVTLKDGDRVRLGALELVFEEPLSRAATPAFLAGAGRELAPDVVVRALADLGDPRAALWLVEALAPDPAADREAAWTVAALGLGEEVARQVVAWRQARAASAAAHARERLARLAPGVDQGGDPVATWVAWWAQARLAAPPQVAPERAPRGLRLRVVAGEAAPPELVVPDAGVVLAGRDPRCQLQLRTQAASRLHATLLRLHRRLAVRDEGSRAGTSRNGARVAATFVDPGDALDLADVRLALEHDPPPREALLRQVGPRAFAVDPLTALALEELGHPAALAGLVGALAAAERMDPRLEASARALFPGDAARAGQLLQAAQQLLVGRAQRARALLVARAGRDLRTHAEAAAWAATAGATPAGVVPQGWLADGA